MTVSVSWKKDKNGKENRPRNKTARQGAVTAVETFDRNVVSHFRGKESARAVIRNGGAHESDSRWENHFTVDYYDESGVLWAAHIAIDNNGNIVEENSDLFSEGKSRRLHP